MLGQPVVAEGLEIATRRAQFTPLVRTIATPMRPVVRMRFDRQGRVADASIVRSSGFEDVDEPVLNAVYSWTAKGERLSKISPLDPKAGITLTFTILFR